MTVPLATLLFALSSAPAPVGPADIAALRTAGRRLPDATLPTVAGKTLRLRSLIGRPAVVVVFASWCDPCRADLPSVVRAWSRRRDATFVGIDELESVESARRFGREMHVPFATAVLTSAAFSWSGRLRRSARCDRDRYSGRVRGGPSRGGRALVHRQRPRHRNENRRCAARTRNVERACSNSAAPARKESRFVARRRVTG